jgi:putative holliday junction resolvase
MQQDKTQTPEPASNPASERAALEPPVLEPPASEPNERRRLPPPLDVEVFRDKMQAGQRLIGIDVGTKTLGLALSDVNRTIASGLETIRRTKFRADADHLLALATRHGVGGLVIGLPLNLDGTEGPRAQSTRSFQRSLAQLTDLPMMFWDERLSTAAAERTLLEGDASRRRRAEVIDKMAATIILQTAMDRMRR